MKDKEKLIQERRLIEATQKNLMGRQGKLACIARFLGSEIRGEGSDLFSCTPLPDVWGLPEEESIRSAGEDDTSYLIGYLFDGLSRGMHLEIIFNMDEKTCKVSYMGHSVFREVGGELEAYAPMPEWEDMIERLYKVARPIAKSHLQVENEEYEKVKESKIIEKLREIKLRWGIK